MKLLRETLEVQSTGMRPSFITLTQQVQEIVERSWEIGTYDTSVLPYEDCCTIFVAKHPVTKPNLNVIRKSEEKLAEKIDELMEAALSTAEVIEIQ